MVFDIASPYYQTAMTGLMTLSACIVVGIIAFGVFRSRRRFVGNKRPRSGGLFGVMQKSRWLFRLAIVILAAYAAFYYARVFVTTDPRDGWLFVRMLVDIAYMIYFGVIEAKLFGDDDDDDDGLRQRRSVRDRLRSLLPAKRRTVTAS